MNTLDLGRVLMFARCLMILLPATLFGGNFNQECFADSIQAHQTITVAFKDAKTDAFYRPHQIVTISVQAEKLSLPVSATFLFDTGSTHCAISASLAARLGLPQRPLKDVLGNTIKFDGKTAIGVNVEQINVGSLHVRDVPINILPDEQLTQALGQPVDGILGSDIWRSLAVHLDFTKNELTFVASKNPVTYSELASNATDLTPHDIGQFGFSEALTVLLLQDAYTCPASFVLKNGTRSAVESLLIDTGSPRTVISKPTADLLGLKPIFKADYVGIKTFSVSVSWLPALYCGSLTSDDLLVGSPNDFVEGFIPRLGLDVLANYDILFDFPHLKMYLKPRTDLQALTSRQYETASSVQRRQWAQKRLMIVYPTLDGYAIPYSLNAAGLPLAQVRTDWAAQPLPFLLKTNTANVFIPEALVRQWGLKAETMLQPDGKPFLRQGHILNTAKISSLYFGSAEMDGDLVVLPADLLSPATSYQPVSGVIGANICFSKPLLMDPQTQTWLQIWKALQPEDLKSLNMADAAIISVQDPDDNDNLTLPVEASQGAAHCTDTLTLATGSPFTLLSAEAARTLKLTPEPQKLHYGAGKDITVFNRAHLTQLSIGGVVLKNVQVAYPIGAMPDDFYPRLGMNVISKLRLLVDAPAKKIYTKKAEI